MPQHFLKSQTLQINKHSPNSISEMCITEELKVALHKGCEHQHHEQQMVAIMAIVKWKVLRSFLKQCSSLMRGRLKIIILHAACYQFENPDIRLPSKRRSGTTDGIILHMWFHVLQVTKLAQTTLPKLPFLHCSNTLNHTILRTHICAKLDE